MWTFEANCKFEICEDEEGNSILVITDQDEDQVNLSRFESEVLVDYLLEAFDEADDDCDDCKAFQEEEAEPDCTFRVVGPSCGNVDDGPFEPCGMCSVCILNRDLMRREIEGCTSVDCLLCLGIEEELRKY